MYLGGAAIMAASALAASALAAPPPLRALMTSTPTVYEISTRPWLYSLSLKYGRNFTLGQVPTSEWEAIAAKGCDVVWLMGVWQVRWRCGRTTVCRRRRVRSWGRSG